MAGLHGKNAELRVSISETAISGVVTGQLGTGSSGNGVEETLNGITRIFRAASGSRDWRYDKDRTLIQFSNKTAQGPATLVDTSIGVQTNLINYAGGGIHLGQYPLVASGVYAMAVSMSLTTVGSLVGDARGYSVKVSSDTIDTTTIGETWATMAEGFQKFEGSLDGLYINDFWYKNATATLSGILPRRVLRFRPNPAKATTYYQGTAIFPSYELVGSQDSAIERKAEFKGVGPLDLVLNDAPWFTLNDLSPAS